MFFNLTGKQSFKYAIIIIALALIVIFIWSRFKNDPNKVLAGNVEFGVFTNQDKQNGRSFISVPFSKTEKTLSFINVALDINGSGDFEEGEWVVKNMPALPLSAKRANYYFTPGLPLEGAKRARAVLSDFPLTEELWEGDLPEGRQFIEVEAAPKIYDIGEFISGAAEIRFQESTTTLEEVGEFLKSNPDFEAEINLYDPAVNEIVGGHKVKLVKIYSTGEKTYVEIEDGAGPDGYDVYEVSDSQILNYGPFDGMAVLNIMVN